MNSSRPYALSAKRVGIGLGLVAAILVILHIIAMQAIFNNTLEWLNPFDFDYWQLSVFDLDAEESFGTWFSSLMLLSAGLLLLHHGRLLRTQQEAWSAWWMVLGGGFVVLSIDEVVALHELLNTALEDTSWTVVGMVGLAILGLAYVPFLWDHRDRDGFFFMLAGAIYAGGAVGVERYTDAEVNSLHYNMWTAVEEGMEMLGVIVFIYALVGHLGTRRSRHVRIELEDGSPT